MPWHSLMRAVLFALVAVLGSPGCASNEPHLGRESLVRSSLLEKLLPATSSASPRGNWTPRTATDPSCGSRADWAAAAASSWMNGSC
jgi:hypothetical protein